MLDQGSENELVALHVAVTDVVEDGFDGFEVARASELVEQGGAGRVVMPEPRFRVVAEKSEGIGRGVGLLHFGDEGNWVPKLPPRGSERPIVSAL